MRASKARLACQRRRSVDGKLCRHTPEAGAVCWKAARTVLGGERAMKRTSLPLLKRRAFIMLPKARLGESRLGLFEVEVRSMRKRPHPREFSECQHSQSSPVFHA
jgi:hypothetical protein